MMPMKRRFLFWGLIPVLVVLVAALALTRSARAQAVTCNIALGRTTINRGESTTLSWYSSGAVPVVVDGLQVATGHGNKTITPASSRTYSIVVGWNSACTKSISITVNPVAVTCSFSASSTTIFSGSSTTLNWSSSNGSNWGISPSIGGTIGASGSRSVSPNTTTTYSFVVNFGGANQCLRTVTVTVRYRFNDNRPNVPGRFSWSNGTYCGSGTLLHDRAGWLSASGNTSQESTSVAVGQNSVAALINLVGRACTAPDYSNADSNDLGRVKNRSVDGDAVYVRSATTSSSPSISGVSSTLQGKSVSISRSGQYSTRPGSAWTSIASSSFSVDGLGGLAPGTYNITINADVVYTSILNGSLVCSANQASTSSVVGSNCPTNNVQFTISITVPPGTNNPPSPQCEMFGPTPNSINVGESAEFGWSVTDAATVQLLVNGVTTTVGHVVSGYSVSPETTTEYFITATDSEGEQVTCSLEVIVQDSPDPDPESFLCTSNFFQLRNGILHEIDPPTGTIISAKNTGVPNLNAMGYNINDGYFYAIKRATGGLDTYLYRIDSSGTATRIDVPKPSPVDSPAGRPNGAVPGTVNTIAGDMDRNDNLWYIPDPTVNEIIKLNVVTLSYERYTLTRTLVNGPGGYNIQYPNVSDIVFYGEKIYGIDSKEGYLLTIDTTDITSGFPNDTMNSYPSAARIANIPFLGGVPYVSGWGFEYTSMWVARNGKIYAFFRGTNQIIELTVYTTTTPGATVVYTPSSSTAFANTDGASCPNARDPFEKINHPYVRVKGSDVVAGAVFGDGTAGASCQDRRDLYPPSGQGTIQTNGYRQHAYNSSDVTDIIMGSSSAEYAAFALGDIASGRSGLSSFISNNGYYRAYSGTDTSRVRDVAFANNLSGAKNTYGNFYATANLPCIDITQIEKELPAVENVIPSNIQNQIQTGNGILRADTDIALPVLNLGNDGKVILYVDGKVTINGNITGGFASDGNGILNGAQLTIIAKGGIDIAPSVIRIDAYLIAYNHTLKTCSDIGTPTTNTCSNKLTVNGGLAGRKIEWRRNYGTLGKDDTTIPVNGGDRCAVGSEGEAAGVTTINDYSAITDALDRCAAEFIEFDPSFYFANPFTISNGESSISGKPLNTTELPPVY